jgi:hypothetical protein
MLDTGTLPNIDAFLDELLAEAGQRTREEQEPTATGKWVRGGMTVKLHELITDGTEGGRGARFMSAVRQLKQLGWSIDGMVWLFEQHPDGVAGKYEKRLRKEVERAFQKVQVDGACLGDFFAYMPLHQFYYAPTRRLWPASSINARFAAVAVLDDDGQLRLTDKKKPLLLPAAMWLDQNRPVEEMTWSPGDPMLVHDRLIVENMGWMPRPGDTTFNLYRPPIIQDGDARKARPWLRLIVKIFGKQDARHIILWLSHRAQRPQEKINHGLVLGGAPGIGKDTILAPARLAVGEWNFAEASPMDMLGHFNPFARAVILRINEARDLGEISQFKLYDHMKQYMAAPPPTLPVNEKYIKHYSVPNVCGVIFTTNYKENGLYLPPDDRRHFVAWSERTAADFAPGFWSDFWDWYHDGGFWHVVAYLRQRDISKFRPGEEPPKTQAFWDIANANRAADETALDDILDAMGRPAVVTVERILMQPNIPFDLADWLRSHKYRRVFPKHFSDCGYLTVHNSDTPEDRGRWRISGTKQVVYGRKDLPRSELIAAARKLTRGQRERF